MYTDDTLLTSGIYKYCRLCTVPAKYLLKVHSSNGTQDKELLEYIKKNLEKIKARSKGSLNVPAHKKSCEKQTFLTEKEAKFEIKRIKNLEEEEHKIPVRTYECEICTFWHLTSIPLDKWGEIKKEISKNMVQTKIVEIKSNQLSLYKDFLNVGLIEDEENFRITPSDDIDAPFPTKDTADSFTLAAYFEDVLAGIVSFTREGADREKLKHKGILFRMYVSRDFRGHGIARALVNALIARVKQLPDIEQINLTVVSDNVFAKVFYEKLGFVTFATELNAIKWKNKYYTEEQMVLRLK